MNTLILAASQVKGPHIDWAALSPILAPAAGGLIVLLVGLLSSSLVRERVVPALTLIAFAASIGCAIWRFNDPASIVSGALRIDDLALILDMLFSVAGIGASSMITGSWPITVIWWIRAIGVAPIAFSPAALTTSTAAAPSQIWLALAAVIMPPSCSVFMPAIFSRLASARMPSSVRCTRVSPSGVVMVIGTISRSRPGRRDSTATRSATRNASVKLCVT